MQFEKKEVQGVGRLLLGFDAGCIACTDLARRIKEQVNHKLEIRSLRDPQVQHWRENALGKDAPWAPTLFKVEGTKVRAWTGWRMGVQLGRFLGPVATWRVMQALGEVGAAPRAEESPVARAAGGLTRGQFLKGVGGAVVAMTALSGAGNLASPAEAATITNTTEVTGSSLVSLARSRAKFKDMINIGGQTWSDGMQTGTAATLSRTYDEGTMRATVIHHNPAAGTNSHWKADGSLYVDDGDTVIKAANHTYSDGNTMVAVAFQRSNDRVMHHYRYDQLVKHGIYSEAFLWKYDATSKRFDRKKSSHNGVLDTPIPTTTTQSQDAVTTQATEEPCGTCYDYYSTTYGYYGYYADPVAIATGVDFRCVRDHLSYCPACLSGFALPLVGPADVLTCVLVLCPGFFLVYCSLVGGELCISCYYE